VAAHIWRGREEKGEEGASVIFHIGLIQKVDIQMEQCAEEKRGGGGKEGGYAFSFPSVLEGKERKKKKETRLHS